MTEKSLKLDFVLFTVLLVLTKITDSLLLDNEMCSGSVMFPWEKKSIIDIPDGLWYSSKAFWSVILKTSVEPVIIVQINF